MGIRSRFMRAAILGVWPFLSLPLAADHCCECCAEFARSTKTMFPTDIGAVMTYCHEAKQQIDQIFEKIELEATFENTAVLWDKKVRLLINRLIVLQSLGVIVDDQDLVKNAQLFMYDIAFHFMNQLALNPQYVERIISYLESADLEPFQVHYALNLLQGLYEGGLGERMTALRKKLVAMPQQPFMYRQGNAQELVFDREEISVLSLNVCNLPEKLPLIFGGILPWSDRVEGVVKIIKENAPDVLCLQEVFEYEGNEELYEALKDEYAHFYMHIGPRNASFDPQIFGLASGLFVASKYPIENAQFRAFDVVGLSINRGVFDFTVGHTHFYTTHLETHDNPIGRKARLAEMQQLVEIVNTEASEDTISIACGDMNIQWNQGEEAQDIMLENFHSPLTDGLDKITMANRTYLDYTDFWWKAHAELGAFTEVPEIYDFVLLSRKTPGKATVQIVSMNDEDRPMHALSDHQALFAKISR